MAKLRLKYGTMNSGKSAHLLMVRHNYLEQSKRVLIFKPKIDTRDYGVIKSRALGVEAPAILIGEFDKDRMFLLTKDQKPDCVLVDEVQFMKEFQVEELGKIVDLLKIPVISYGLMTDFQGKIFDSTRRLIEIGAIIEEIKTVCWYCKQKAVFNMRLNNEQPVFEGEKILVGGNESYRPVCRSCYNRAKTGEVL